MKKLTTHNTEISLTEKRNDENRTEYKGPKLIRYFWRTVILLGLQPTITTGNARQIVCTVP